MRSGPFLFGQRMHRVTVGAGERPVYRPISSTQSVLIVRAFKLLRLLGSEPSQWGLQMAHASYEPLVRFATPEFRCSRVFVSGRSERNAYETRRKSTHEAESVRIIDHFWRLANSRRFLLQLWAFTEAHWVSDSCAPLSIPLPFACELAYEDHAMRWRNRDTWKETARWWDTFCRSL